MRKGGCEARRQSEFAVLQRDKENSYPLLVTGATGQMGREMEPVLLSECRMMAHFRPRQSLTFALPGPLCCPCRGAGISNTGATEWRMTL